MFAHKTHKQEMPRVLVFKRETFDLLRAAEGKLCIKNLDLITNQDCTNQDLPNLYHYIISNKQLFG